MKRNIAWTVFFAAMLLVSLTAAAWDRDEFTCSLDKIAGTWGYSETGSAVVYDSTGKTLATVPYASVGRYTIDRDGDLSGARTASSGGTLIPATITGTATVNADCTGTLTLQFWNPSDPTKSLGSATKYVVYLKRATEARMIVTSTPITPYPPGGTGSLGAILTTDAKKMFPGHGDVDRDDR